jgi:hypothetical protein
MLFESSKFILREATTQIYALSMKYPSKATKAPVHIMKLLHVSKLCSWEVNGCPDYFLKHLFVE